MIVVVLCREYAYVYIRIAVTAYEYIRRSAEEILLGRRVEKFLARDFASYRAEIPAAQTTPLALYALLVHGDKKSEGGIKN
jgi:hypothetical protein